jgi:hypothetical protein
MMLTVRYAIGDKTVNACAVAAAAPARLAPPKALRAIDRHQTSTLIRFEKACHQT